MPSLDYNNEGVVHAFLDNVINKFGTLAEIFTNHDILVEISQNVTSPFMTTCEL